MTPIDWATRPLKKYADFTGRAPRAEFWWFYLGTLVAYLVAMIVDSLVGIELLGPYGLFTLLIAVALILPGLAATVRRLHDTNRSGWWVLIAVVPYFIMGVMMGRSMASGDTAGMASAGLVGLIALAGGIAMIVFMVLPGNKGDNRFGPDPHAGESGAAIAAE
jgi:uncharacterized membrane protein YhaH (DUF805 family)